jgi:hypothetical protein
VRSRDEDDADGTERDVTEAGLDKTEPHPLWELYEPCSGRATGLRKDSWRNVPASTHDRAANELEGRADGHELRSSDATRLMKPSQGAQLGDPMCGLVSDMAERLVAQVLIMRCRTGADIVSARAWAADRYRASVRRNRDRCRERHR